MRTPFKILTLLLGGAIILCVFYLSTTGKSTLPEGLVQEHYPFSALFSSTTTPVNGERSREPSLERADPVPTIALARLPATSTSITNTAPPISTMRLTFQDEFDTFRRYVDAKGNISCGPGGVGIWQTVYHFCSRTIASNNEGEVYIDENFLSYLNSRTATPTKARVPLTVTDGILAIEAAPSDRTILAAVGPWAKYTSGLLTTQFSFAQQYGYFEMRAKIPPGRGLWPAFWLLPIDKSWPPEVDAMEAFGDTSIDKQGGRTKIHYGSHSQKKSESCGDWHDVGVDITKDFHTYGVLVEATGMTYYFDEKPYATCPANSGTNQPFYMIVNLAIGGPGSWPGTPDQATIFPAYMYVDYVRAYQKI